MAQPTSSSSPFTYTYSHDVFLSFRGKDTRTGFTGNLYSALCQRGVLTFIDDAGLSKGEEITPSLLKAIQKSRMAIIIFSKNYASSTFCLNELVEILECYTKEKGRWIWPVFYDVDPSEVRHQMGSFGEALAKHERGRFKDDIEKVQKWRLALRQAADLSGWHFKHGGEYEHVFIRRITEEVSSKLNRPLLHVANYPVGLEARMREVQLLMNADFDNKVNMLGIYGIGGIGKSTVARAIFNLIADKFEGSCFLADVREKSIRHGLVQIQETMLSQLVGERNIKLGDVNHGIPILKERLHRKKVLLILDGVDKKEQLQATAGGLDWFGFGSFIIITTRDKHLLDIHGVEKLFEVNELNDTKALELFRWNALKKNEVDPSHMEIINRAIHYTSGLPLALETIGSNLFGKTLDEWKSALEAYERIPNRDVLEILRVSYDSLEENEKEIFLDIACFFKGCNVRYVTNILHARGFHPKYGIGVLERKSLIKIMRYGLKNMDSDIVTMHDLIQYMGKEIVRQQSTWPEKRNRLWFHEDIIHILEKNKQNDEIEAMMLDMLEDKEVQWNQEVFRKMKNLKMLIKRTIGFFSKPKYLPNSLRVLEWWGYPSASLPSNFLPKNLVMLNLSHSYFQWDKPLESLKFLSHLIFKDCENIRQIPDVSGFSNLIELSVDYCINLTEIHDSFGFLDKLQRFSAKGCTKLSIIPRVIKLTSLEYLCLEDCNSLNIVPEISGPMKKLQFVDFTGTSIENLPLSMQNLGGLQTLSLSRCTMLNINALSNIIQMLPNFFPFLEQLNLTGSNLTILPACIEECQFLKKLILSNCKQLREIRGLPPSKSAIYTRNCTSLNASCPTLNILLKRALSNETRHIFLPGQRIPEWFDHFSRGHSLCFWFRKEFPAITVGAVLGFGEIGLHVKINNDTIQRLLIILAYSGTDVIYLTNSLSECMSKKNRSLFLENKWNQAEILFLKCPNQKWISPVRWTGVYVNRKVTSMEDVRFTNPYPSKYTYDHSYYGNHDLDRAVLDYAEKDLGESSQAPCFAQAQNIQASSPTSSSGKGSGEELHLKANFTMLPTTIDKTFSNQIEPSQDDVEMEAFYASLAVGTHVLPHSHDKLIATAPIEEAKAALKNVQDFFSNDASILLHPEKCSVLKTSLDYLSNLCANDGISGEMRTLILEASRVFTYWSRDYSEASMKIESTASELLIADELEVDLEDNKKQFNEVAALEKEMLQKLACMEESKKELEEQIHAIKADISASQSEKNMTHKRKRHIFEEGNILKFKMDELRQKVPCLQHEQGLAKKTQAKITDEWSKLGEKFKNIAEE